MTSISIDTQIIIAILSNNASGHRTPTEWDAIRTIVAQIDAKDVMLTLPTIAFAELLPSHHGPDVGRVLNRLARGVIDVRELTQPIARRAAELRDSPLRSGRRLKTVDAVFIATAESARCACLYSADADVYRATGASIPLVRPGASDVSYLPGNAFAA